MERIIIITILLSIFCLSPFTVFSQETGDVNTDGSVDIIDALLVAQYYVGLNPPDFTIEVADTNCDISIDIVDALLIAQYYVGLISTFQGCETPSPTPDTSPTPTQTPGAGSGPLPTINPTPDPTPSPPPPAGSCWFSTSNPEDKINSILAAQGDAFNVHISLSTGNQKLSSYEFEVTFDPEVLTLNTGIGMNGVEPGADGFVTQVIIIEPGVFRIKGFDPAGRGPSYFFDVCRINFIGTELTIWTEASLMTFNTLSLIDENSQGIGNPGGGNPIYIDVYPVEPTLIEGNNYVFGLFWTGNQYGVFWGNSSRYISAAERTTSTKTAHFVQLDDEGNRIGTALTLPESGDEFSVGIDENTLGWNGNQYAYLRRVEIDGTAVFSLVFTAHDSTGSLMTENVLQQSNKANEVLLKWVDDHYCMLWRQSAVVDGAQNYYTFYSRLDAAGNMLQDPVNLGYFSHLGYEASDLIWTGQALMFLYTAIENGNYVTYAFSFDSSGVMIKNELFLDSSYESQAVFWDGNAYACVIKRISDGSYIFTHIDSTGKWIGPDTLITTISGETHYTYRFVITKIGNQYTIGWGEREDDNTFTRACIIDASGDILHRNENIGDSTDIIISNRAFTWTGTEYGAAFFDYRNTDLHFGEYSEVYFCRLNSELEEIGTEIKITDIYNNP